MRRSVCECRRSLLQESWLDFPPLALVAFQEFVGNFRPPRPGCVIRKLARRYGRPNVQYWIDDAPPGFDHVGALKQGRIADHAVVEQNLITGMSIRSKIPGILKAHLYRSHSQHGPWNLRPKTQRNTFHRLDLHYKCITVQLAKSGVSEKLERSALELNSDLGMAFGH